MRLRRRAAGSGHRPGAPRVVALIPAYNEEATVGAVLDVLAQAPRVDEVLVVSDGSSGSTSSSGALVVSPPSVNVVTVNTQLHAQHHGQRGCTALHWSLIGGTLPPGLQFNQVGQMAVVSGTPSAVGTYTFTVQVKHSAGTTVGRR